MVCAMNQENIYICQLLPASYWMCLSKTAKGVARTYRSPRAAIERQWHKNLCVFLIALVFLKCVHGNW
jgi:hypothetical protein